ncbi:MAG: LPS export ABC transporter periplasmic protein LptC [Candidatus Cloacimonetes bacterium]|nr:LPS export ABC transporter periplasmic protein LptC [Candidatus Cloacimonadota bacterium]
MKPFVSIVILLFTLCACQKATLQNSKGVLERGVPDEISYDVNLTQFKDTEFEYTIQAKKIERFHDRRLMHGYSVTLTTYDKNGKINSTIKADTTIVDDARNLVFANGNTKMTSPNGTLATSRLTWDRGVDEITAPEKVTLTRDGSVLRGDNLRTNSKLSLVLMDNISAEGIINQKDIDW